MDKLIIVVAPVGAEVTRKDNPNLPITPAEIAAAVKDCRDAGASVVHLHVRDKDGNPTQDKSVFRDVIQAVKDASPDIIVQVSTGGAVWMKPEERIQSVYAHDAIEMATLTTGTLDFGEDIFANTFNTMEVFARAIKERGLKPEIECFDAGHVNNAAILVKRGLISPPLHYDFVLGVPGGMVGGAREVVFMSQSIPAGSSWQVAGIGRYELPCATMAILMGGHVRVGFEDNIFYSKGRLADGNAQLVARISRLAAELGRDVATPDEARNILGIKKRG